MLIDTPWNLANEPDGVYGDQEEFFKSLEEGEQERYYDDIIRGHLRSMDNWEITNHVWDLRP